jgi:DtxR family Mn-dependent transcriptional regulator
LQPALQDYLKAVHQLTESDRRGRASTSGIARILGVSAPSVSAMLDRMAAEGLINYVHYAGASLTADGRRAALRVIRRHRLLELFLVTHLGLGWEEVHDEADRLEHVLSDRLEAAIDEVMGFPDRDPHGDPIPGRDGNLRARSFSSLWEASAGIHRVDRVSDADTGLLRLLADLGLTPGAKVEVISSDRGGAMRLRVEDRRPQVIGRDAAESVYVAD